jgi:hypothetical protein
MDQIQLLPIASLRVSKKQKVKVSHDKVHRHLLYLERGGEDVYPIDVHKLGDGTYIVAGNGRHRYFAYALAGYLHIPAIVQNT